MRRRRVGVAALGLLLCACSGPTKKTNVPATTSRAETAAGKQFPVSEIIPGHVVYAAVAARLGDLASMLKGTLHPFVSDNDIRRIEPDVTGAFGFDPFSTRDLSSSGFAVDGNLAIYGTTAYFTVLIPVADAERVKQVIDAQARRTTVTISEHRGVQPIVWSGGNERWTVVVTGAWVAVHYGNKRAESDPLAWLDELLDMQAAVAKGAHGLGLSGEADWQWAWDRNGARKGGLLLVRTGALWDAIRDLDVALGERDANMPCGDTDKAVHATFGRIAGAAEIGAQPASFDGALFVELERPGVAALRGGRAPAPDGSYLALRDGAGASLSWSLDLHWLGETLRGAVDERCGGITSALARDFRGLDDPSTNHAKRAFTSYHVALLGGGMSGLSLDPHAIAWLGVADPAAARDALADLPPSSPITVAGHAARAIDLSDYRLAEPIRWTDDYAAGGTLRAGVGKGLLEALLAPAEETTKADPNEAWRIVYQPERMTDLVSAAVGLLALAGGNEADLASAILEDVAGASFAGSIEDEGIRMVAAWRLR